MEIVCAIFVKAIALEDSDGNQSILITTDLNGYVTSCRVQNEGGYVAKVIYGKGLIDCDAEKAYVEKIKELAFTMGRPLPKMQKPISIASCNLINAICKQFALSL